MVVKAKPEEKLTMNASVTGVKTITVEFNKAIADASKVKATVKKGTADRACTATVDGSKITLAMDAKLIKGTYTVSVEGVADTAMTADVVVEKDETLTSFKVSSVATMARTSDSKATPATNSAVVVFEALNQYNERMTVSDPQVSCTLGKADISKSATATAAGEITITDMQAVMAIQGTKGTVILVDKNTGVNANAEVTVSTAATPATLDVVGVYNANSNKMEELKAGAKLYSGNYYILFTAKDQYENDFTNESVFDKITTISIAGGLTKVELPASNYLSSRTVDGKDYLAIKLGGGIAEAGSYNVTIVNNERGMLLNNAYTVADSVVVKSINITADKGLYANKGEQELSYEIIDQNGNSVTSYAVLNDVNLVRFGSTYGSFKFVKNTDGTAKLVFDAGADLSKLQDATSKQKDDDKESTPLILTVYANPQTSSNLIVKPITLTVYEQKIAKNVSKLKADTATVLALGKKLEVSLGDIVYADQYGNDMSASDAGLDKATNDKGEVKVTSGAIEFNNQTSFFADVKDGMTVTISDDNKKLVFSAPSSKSSSATVYLRYGKQASASDYDCKFIVTATDTTGVDASTLKIKSINSGNMVKADLVGSDYKATITVDKITVVGKIGGVDTVIPTSQYVIKSTKDMTITGDEYNKGTKTKTATVTIQVTTQDANGTRTETELTGTFKITAATSFIAKVDGVKDAGVVAGVSSPDATVTGSALKALFKYKDQFGGDLAYTPSTSGAGDVKISVDVYKLPTGLSAEDCKIVGSGTSDTTVYLTRGYTAKDENGKEISYSYEYILSVKAFMLDADGKETSAKTCKVKASVAANGTVTYTIL